MSRTDRDVVPFSSDAERARGPTSQPADGEHAEPDGSSVLGTAVVKVRRHGLRYAGVSVFNVILGQGLLFWFENGLGWGATRSNITAVCIGAVPAYYLNRAFVWGKRGRSHFAKEVLPFWVFIAIGLVFSSITVTVATSIFPDTPIVSNIANLGAFGILWVLRFFVLDKLFHLDQEVDGDADEPDVGAPPIL
jgi:putative flippase GtrA